MASNRDNSFFLLLGKFTSRRGFPNSGKYALFLLISLFMCVSDLCQTNYTQSLNEYLLNLSLPLKCWANKIAEFPKIVYHYVDLKNENKELKLELEKMKLRSIAVSDIENELRELKQVLNLRYDSRLFKYMEKALGFDDSIYSSFLLISATQPTTKRGSIAISSNGVVGLVLNSSANIAKVLPITSSKMFIPVKSNSGEHLILQGTGKDELISVEVQNTNIQSLKPNDILYTSGEGGVYTPEIPVARVSSINESKTQISAKPIADLNRVNYIWTIPPVNGGNAN